MLDMKTRTALLALAAGAAAIVAACSGTEEPPADVAPTSSSVSPTATFTSTAPTSTAPVGPTGTTTNTTSTGGTGTTSGGTGTTSGATSETCDAPPVPPKDVTLGGVYDYGDEKTTRNFTQPMVNMLCLDGTAFPAAGEPDADGVVNDYEFWGAGIGLQVAADATTPYNATADKIAGVQFDISQWAERPVRVQMSQVNDPAITDDAMNFQNNGFVYGGSSPKSTKADKTLTIMFEDFELPSWSEIPDANQGPLDGAKLHSLQIQIANEPDDPEVAYKFCVSNVQWLDACGQVVGTTTLPAPEGDSTDSSSDTGSGATDSTSGASGSDSAGSDSTSGGSDSASTSAGSDSTSGGSDSTSGGGALDYTADVLPILTAKCGGCHDADTGTAAKWLGDTEPAADVKAKIADRVQREAGAEGKMPVGGTLTADELEAVVTWAEE